VRRQLDAIYKSTPSAKPSRISRFASQGTDWLARSLGGLFGSIFHPNGGKTVVVWLIIGTLITLLVWLWRRSKFGIVPEKTSAIGAQAEERIDWRARADEALARGDLAEAVRCLYHAMLVAFASTGIVEDAPSLTSGEFRTAVGKKRPAMYPQVAGATRVFERVAYGNSIPEARDVDQMRTAERAVRK
jgi:hypothetical protein